MSKQCHFARGHEQYTLFSVYKVVHQADLLAPPSPQLKPGMAGPLWAEGIAWQSHNVGLPGPTCQHSRGLADISIHGCTDPLTSSLDLSFSDLYLPTVCYLLCHPFLPACQLFLSLISRASLDHCFPRVGNA